MLDAVPVTLAVANAFVSRWHRHHVPVAGARFAVGAIDGAGRLVGVAIVGRPVARMRDDGTRAEITRLCSDGSRNVCSFLMGRASNAAKALGFRQIQTYILDTESGVSLRAAGWRFDALGESNPKSQRWNRPNSGRVRGDDQHPLGVKQRWVRDLAPANPVAPSSADLKAALREPDPQMGMFDDDASVR